MVMEMEMEREMMIVMERKIVIESERKREMRGQVVWNWSGRKNSD